MCAVKQMKPNYMKIDRFYALKTDEILTPLMLCLEW